MKQVQGYTTPREITPPAVPGSRRILFGVLAGVAITTALTVIEVGVFWLLMLAHLVSAGPRSLISPIWLWLVLAELIVVSVVSWWAARPVALLLYLRAVHRAQEASHALYTPLTALTNIRKSLEHYDDQETAPTVAIQDEQVSILDLVQQQDTHQLILGVPGAGKTMALRVFQYNASQSRLSLALSHGRIPVYVPMKNYSLFLKQRQTEFPDAQEEQDTPSVALFAYLAQSDLPGMRALRPYIHGLAEKGRLLLLCDGLNEIDSNYLKRVSAELVYLMRSTSNRLVMTCREVDYREQLDFVSLVEDGQAARAVIYPLLPEQVSEFVERYIAEQDSSWKHTAGQIMQVIDRSRLRYHCTNPMMLFTLMGIIDKIGVERGKQIDTRGRLLREYVRQLLEYERRQPRWNRSAPSEEEMVRFLSEVACAARWANDRNAIQLHVSALSASSGEMTRRKLNFDELADELQYWLDEHPAQGPFENADLAEPVPYADLALLIQFALSVALIEISPGGVLSFRHELIAEYFVAEYFFAAARQRQAVGQPIREELLENVGRWSEPVAIWAGLMEKPLELADRFGTLGLSNPAFVLQALALGLVCVGVLWTPPQAEVSRPVILPPSIEEALSVAVRNRAAREELARIFTRCAEEGGQEVYRSLLPLITIDGVDDLLTLLDQTIVPELLFTHLQEVVDDIAYETQVKRLGRVLGRFGGVVVERAAQLSIPAPERSSRLRAAVINILGGTGDPRAVEPLIARLRDPEPFIIGRATNSLVHLGPVLALTRVLQELEQRETDAATMYVHRAALLILDRFLKDQHAGRQVSMMQYQHILERIVPVLTSNYQHENEVQKLASEILVEQGRSGLSDATREPRAEKVITALLNYLPTQNDVAARNMVQTLQAIGTPAAPRLMDLLSHPSELVRVRVIEIFKVVREPRVLPALLRLLADASQTIQIPVAEALEIYAPDSIPGLIDCVLHGANDDLAERAAQILTNIGKLTVGPIIEVLFTGTPVRAQLLVQVLELLHDARAVEPLIELLDQQREEVLLAVTIVRALSQFSDERVIQPLLSVLSVSHPQVYEEAITALSQLGDVALGHLVAALDVSRETVVTPRVRRAILGITPFPGEELVSALEGSSAAQTAQIVTVFKEQGTSAALVLVRHLLHRDENIRDTIHQTLSEMPGPVVVPALLVGLRQPELRKIASTFLLNYPGAAIVPLVDLLTEYERGPVVMALLPQFGTAILRPLLAALDDARREPAQRVMIALVRQSQDADYVVHEIVQLFAPSPPARAYEALLSVLTNELADVCVPALLDGLEDTRLIEAVAEAFVRLSRRASMQQGILQCLLEVLRDDERRHGAEQALIKIGAPAVPGVGDLIIDERKSLAASARLILRDIGVPALPFIWTAHSDKSSPERRTAALEVFHSMPTDVIKDELVELLGSNRGDDIAMAVSLLLERIHEEAKQHYSNRIMVPELIEYIQQHTMEGTGLRIVALLLLLDEDDIVDHLLQALDDEPHYRQQLAYIFLLLSSRAQADVLDAFNDPEINPEFRADLAAILSMAMAPDELVGYVQNISRYGLATNRTGVIFPEELTLALRSLGGLLASGQWHSRKLMELREASKHAHDPAHELFSVLLGWRYEPQIAKLQNDLESQKETFNKELALLTGRIVLEQKRARDFETELEKVREEHGVRGNELQKMQHERDEARAALEQTRKEKSVLQGSLEQTRKEKAVIDSQLSQTLKEKQALQVRIQQTQANTGSR